MGIQLVKWSHNLPLIGTERTLHLLEKPNLFFVSHLFFLQSSFSTSKMVPLLCRLLVRIFDRLLPNLFLITQPLVKTKFDPTFLFLPSLRRWIFVFLDAELVVE